MTAVRKYVPQQQQRPKTAAPVVALRESSIVSLAAHGVLDADQVAAAMRFRAAWETLASNLRPPAYFERVDAPLPQAQAERHDAAKRELGQYRLLLGEHGFGLLLKICGEGYHIRDLYSARRERDTATDILRIHLSAIASRPR